MEDISYPNQLLDYRPIGRPERPAEDEETSSCILIQKELCMIFTISKFSHLDI